MRFTDVDLKNIKECMKGPENILSDDHFYESCSCCDIAIQLPALLARLEAAEAIVLIHNYPCRFDRHGNCQYHFLSKPCKYEAWRKACGK